MTIAAVCGFGIGSSMLLKMSIDKAWRALGYQHEALNVDILSAKSQACDAIFTSEQMAPDLREEVKVPVYAVKKYMDVAEVTKVVQQFLDDQAKQGGD